MVAGILLVSGTPNLLNLLLYIHISKDNAGIQAHSRPLAVDYLVQSVMYNSNSYSIYLLSGGQMFSVVSISILLGIECASHGKSIE